MDDEVKRRAYTSPGRRAQSGATRARIIDAAAELFLAQGYARASTRAIGSAAGVSEASVFANFGSKARLLAFVIVDRVTADADFPLSAGGALSPGMPAEEAAAVLARIIRRAHERSWRLLSIGAAAAIDDPELAAVMRRGGERRLSDLRWVAQEILGADEVGRVAEALWAIAAVDGYRHLVVDLGWTPDDYEAWLAHLIVASTRLR
jgi:AcrR family transcriptional regulator